jgi:pimeloyl-ACP methyl ester carboxylesterase
MDQLRDNMKVLLRIVLGVVAVVILGVSIALLLNIRRESQILERFPPPGQMVDIGGRKLHLQCKGADTKPVVVFESGAFGHSLWYQRAFDEVAKIARVCMYDRAGLGWSESVSGQRSLGDRVDDFHTLMERANVTPPYVLVGHSMGGLLARMYIKKYPDDVVGLVLIESSEEQVNGSERAETDSAASAKQMKTGAMVLSLGIPIAQLRFPDGAPEQEIIQRASVFRAGRDDMIAMSHLSEELKSIGGLGSLGNMPLVVVQQGKPDPNRTTERANEWKEGQARLAQLSTRSESMVATKSWHAVMNDEPELYGVAVGKVLEMLRMDGKQ